MKILLTGGSGQIGFELRRTLAAFGAIEAPGRDSLDLGVPDSIVAAVRAARPALIVNAAAHTAVDAAESAPEQAMALNERAPGILAEEARRLGAALVHYSTDYVFDGEKAGPYSEGDPCRPLNVYGRTKLAGEEAVRASGAAHLILRTSWVYGPRGRNFLLTVRRLARERRELRIVDDQFGAPTSARMVAEATALALARLLPGGAMDAGRFAEQGGLYHLTAAGSASWYEFACAILEGQPDAAKVLPIPASGYPSAARRPRNSVLDNTRFRETFGIALPDWRAGLRLCLEELGD